MNKEKVVGLLVLGIIVGLLGSVGGWVTVLFFVGLYFLATLSVYLYSQKSLLAKTGGVVAYWHVIFRLLLPKVYRKELKNLEKNEQKT